MDERTNALPVGTELEGYRVVALLGAGGFGITYKAMDLLLDRPVAIKEYLPSVLANRGPDRKTVRPFGRQEQEQFVWGLERFRTEAKTLVAFQHSNIVPVHRYFESNGTGYLVMAFQDGKSLADVIDAVGTLSEDELLTILRPLAAGLADIHAKGFLHRDIKPANIIIRRDGTPVLIDFGAARQAVTRQSRGLTAIVTEGYAPYEQYETDSHQGPWTDLYALGAVLYHCVTGQRPPEAPKRIAAKLRNQEDPMTSAVIAAGGNYSTNLLAAIDRALTVEEAKRPQNVREFMTTVENRRAAAPADPPAGPEAFMVEPISLPLGRGPSAAGTREPPSAEVAGNFMVEAPSAPVAWREGPLSGPAPPKVQLSDRVSPGRQARGDTPIGGGATLIVGGTPSSRAAAPASVAAATEAPSAAPPRPHARARRWLPLAASIAGVLAVSGGAVAYFAQKSSAPRAPTPTVAARPAPETVSGPVAPAPPKPEDDAAAQRSKSPPDTLWQHHSPKVGQDLVRRIFVLPNDQALVVGGRIDAEGNNSEAWIWRFNSKEGKPLGERKTIGNARLETGNAAFVLNDGSLALAAARRNPGTNAIIAWVARVSADGDAQWQYSFVGRTLTIPYAVTVLPGGDIVVVGTAIQDDKSRAQGWAARLSADGKTVVWNKLFGKGGDDSLQGVAVLPDGGIIAVGWAGIERPAGEDRNLWIVNLDADGNVRWEKKDLGDDADEKGKAVLVAPGGDIVVLAEVSRTPPAPSSRSQPVADSNPINKPWLLRLGPDGTVRWDKRLSGGKDDKSDSLDSIAAIGDGFVMAGSTESKGAGRKDGWLVRVDADGNTLWDKPLGEQFDDEFTALAAMPDGGVLVGGSTAQKLDAPAPPPQPTTRPQRVPPKPEPPQIQAKLWFARLGYP